MTAAVRAREIPNVLTARIHVLQHTQYIQLFPYLENCIARVLHGTEIAERKNKKENHFLWSVCLSTITILSKAAA